MLDQVKQPITIYHVKQFFFKKFSILAIQTDQLINVSVISFLIYIVAITFFNYSIIFHEGLDVLWDYKQVANFDYLNYINFINLYQNDGVDVIIQAIIIGLILSFEVLMALHLLNLLPTNSFLYWLVYIERILRLIDIPLFNVVVYDWVCTNCSSIHNISKYLLTIIFIIYLIMASLFRKFYFNPFPLKNITAKLNTDFELFSFWLDLLKVVFLQFGGVSLTYIASILVIDLGKLYFIRTWMEDKVWYTLRIPTYLSAYLASIILINQIYDGMDIGLFNIWILGSVGIILTLIVKWIRSGYQYTNKIQNCVDASDDNIISMSFQFIKIENWGNLSMGFISNLLGFLCFHIKQCKSSQCYLKSQEEQIFKLNANHLKQNSQELKIHIQQFLLKLIYQKCSHSEEMTALYLVVCFQTNQWAKIKKSLTPSGNLCYEYIKSIIDQKQTKRDHNEDISITEENYQLSRTQFFSQLNKVINSLKFFFTQLKIKRPSIDILNKRGHDAYLQIEDVRKLFLRLLKSDHFDLRVIQVYMEFMINLLKDDKITEYVCRVSKHKWSLFSSNMDLLQASAPSIQIDPDEEKIININSESIKLLKFHRIDIYDKKVQNFLHPYDFDESLREFFEKIVIRSVFCFLRDSSGMLLPVIISGRIKQQRGKQSSLIEIQTLNRLNQEAYILVNNDNDFVESHPASLYKNKTQRIFMGDFYNNSIAKQIQRIKFSKFANIEYQGSNLHVLISQTIHRQYYVIKVQIKKILDSFPAQRTNKAIQISQNNIQELQFIPSISYNQKTVQIQGVFESNQDNNNEGIIEIHLENDQNDKLSYLHHIVDYGEDIKSYRLDGDIIYNIELEQNKSQQQQQMGQDERFQTQKFVNQGSRKQKIKYFYICLITVSIFYFGMYVFTVISQLSIFKDLESQNRLQTILTFQNRFQRMLGILRDVKLDIHYKTNTTWQKQISKLFYDIQASQDQLKFSKILLTMTLNGRTSTTVLDQLCSLLLGEMFRIANNNNMSTFQEVNNNSINIVDPALRYQKRLLIKQRQDRLNEYILHDIIVLALHIVLILIFLALVIYLNFTYRQEKETILRPWRILADQQIQSILDRLGMFEVLLMFSQRSEDVEVYDSLKQNKTFNRRDFPKQLNRTNDKRNRYWIFLIIGLVLLGCAINGFSIVNSQKQVDGVRDSHMMNQYFPSVYIEIVRLSKYNSLVTAKDILEINQMSIKLVETAQQMSYGDQELRDGVKLVFYQDYCQFVQLLNPGVASCKNYAAGFSYTNPFVMGYSVYFNAMVYELVNNITNVYPCSGVIGYAFSSTMDYFISILVEEKIKNIRLVYKQKIGYFMGALVLCFVTWIIIVLIYTTNATEVKRIQNINNLLPITSVKIVSNNQGYQSLPQTDNNKQEQI